MRLRVIIQCEECHRQVALLVEGEEFDVADVRHECDALRGFEVTRSEAAQLTIAA